jgi:hypothetical protein
MGLLTKTARSKLPGKDFAGPGRSFPVNDKAHAKAAILDSKFAPPADRARIIAKAKAKLK